MNTQDDLIKSINHKIHDLDLSFKDTSYDQVAKKLYIGIMCPNEQHKKLIWKHMFLKKYAVPVYLHKLVVGNVESHNILDKAEIGGGTINELVYRSGELTVYGVVPYEVKIKVSKLTIELRDTGEKVGEEYVYRIF